MHCKRLLSQNAKRIYHLMVKNFEPERISTEFNYWIQQYHEQQQDKTIRQKTVTSILTTGVTISKPTTHTNINACKQPTPIDACKHPSIDQLKHPYKHTIDQHKHRCMQSLKHPYKHPIHQQQWSQIDQPSSEQQCKHVHLLSIQTYHVMQCRTILV